MFQDVLVIFNCLLWKLFHIQLGPRDLQQFRIFNWSQLVDFSSRAQSWPFTCVEFTTGKDQIRTGQSKSKQNLTKNWNKISGRVWEDDPGHWRKARKLTFGGSTFKHFCSKWHLDKVVLNLIQAFLSCSFRIATLMFNIFRIVVHSKNSLPLIEEEGMGVQPNTATNLALDRVLNPFSPVLHALEVFINPFSGNRDQLSLQISILRQPEPYGDCKHDWSKTP